MAGRRKCEHPNTIAAYEMIALVGPSMSKLTHLRIEFY